ncbi:MAG: hypothetical protein AABZ60_02325 [Planctomycetota bacterium]
MFVAEFALIKKEFITNLRSRRPYVLLVGAFLLYSLMLASMWPEKTNYRLSNDIAEFVLVLVYVLFVLVNLIVPGLAAGTFTSEREGGTYDMLKGTLLTPWKLVLAKFLVILFFVMVLMASILPIFASCLLGGGVSTSQLIRAFLCILITAILNILFSFYASIEGKNTADSMRKAYVAAFMTIGGISLLGHMLLWISQVILSVFLGSHNAYDSSFIEIHKFWLTLVNPWMVISEIFYPGVLPIGQWSSTSVYLLGSVILFFLTMRRISREEMIQLKLDSRKKIAQKTAFHRKISSFLRYVLSHSKNAIAQKELYNQIYHLPKHQKIINSLGFIFLFGLTLTSVYSRMPGFILINFQIFFFGIIIIGRAASMISREIENEEFDLIRSTLITPVEFVLGKFQAMFSLVFMPLCCCAALNYFFIFGENRGMHYNNYEMNPLSILVGLTVGNLELFAIIATSIMISLAAGSFAKKTSGATALAYFLNFLFYGGIIIFFGLFGLFSIFRNSDLFSVFTPFAITAYCFSDNSEHWGFIFLHAIYVSVCFGVSFLLSYTWISEKRWIDS